MWLTLRIGVTPREIVHLTTFAPPSKESYFRYRFFAAHQDPRCDAVSHVLANKAHAPRHTKPEPPVLHAWHSDPSSATSSINARNGSPPNLPTIWLSLQEPLVDLIRRAYDRT